MGVDVKAVVAFGCACRDLSQEKWEEVLYDWNNDAYPERTATILSSSHYEEVTQGNSFYGWELASKQCDSDFGYDNDGFVPFDIPKQDAGWFEATTGVVPKLLLFARLC